MTNRAELKAAFAELTQSFVAQGHALEDIWRALMDHAYEIETKPSVVQVVSEPVEAAPAEAEQSDNSEPQAENVPDHSTTNVTHIE